MAHKDVRIWFKIKGWRCDATGFLNEGEPAVAGDIMFARTSGKSGVAIGNKDEDFLWKFRDHLPTALRPHWLITNRCHPSSPQYILCLYFADGRWKKGWSSIDHKWSGKYLVVRRSCQLVHNTGGMKMEKNIRLLFGIGLALVFIIIGLVGCGSESSSVGGPIPTNGYITRPACTPIVERASYSSAVVTSPSPMQNIHRINLTNTCDGQLETIRVKFDISATFPVGKWMILEGATIINEGEGSDAGAEMEYNLYPDTTRQFSLLADTTKARSVDTLSARVAAPLRWQMRGQEYESSDNLPLAWTTFTY